MSDSPAAPRDPATAVDLLAAPTPAAVPASAVPASAASPVSPSPVPTSPVLDLSEPAGDDEDLTALMAAFRLFQTHHARTLARESAARGLNGTDTRLVFFLEAAVGGATPKQAGEYLALSTGATTSLIDRLERHGHLERGPNPADRRSVLLHLTPSGAAVAQQIRAVWSAAVREVVAPADRALLTEQFTAFGEALDRHSRAASVRTRPGVASAT